METKTEGEISREQYGRSIKRLLTEKAGRVQADILIDTYKDDFEEFMEKNWDPATAAMAMLMGY